MHYLVTGGCGRLGKHIVKLLHITGHKVTVFDNFSTSTPEALTSLQLQCNNSIAFYQVDLSNKIALLEAMSRAQDGCPFKERDDIPMLKQIKPGNKGYGRIDGVIHCAEISDATLASSPNQQLTSNITASMNLFKIMEAYRIFRLVFRSTLSVYGEVNGKINELSPRQSITLYGDNKESIERELERRSLASPEWRIAVVRHSLSASYESLSNGYISALDFTQHNKGFESFNLSNKKDDHVNKKKAKALLAWAP
jgi:UDP-glucose 4-epimerase